MEDMTMKKIEIDTFLKFRFLSNPHFSPDGTKIAFTVSVPDRETNGYLSDLYLYDLRKKTVSRVTCSGDAKTWSWTAENTLIFTAARTAALKKKGDGTSFLYEISPYRRRGPVHHVHSGYCHRDPPSPGWTLPSDDPS